MNKRNIAVLTVAVLLAVVFAYSAGIEVTKDAWAESLESVQAMLAFNHLRQYQKLSKCLAHDQVDEARRILEMSMINEKELIANFLQSHESGRTVDYISLRYPEGIEELKNFRSNRSSSWTLPACSEHAP